MKLPLESFTPVERDALAVLALSPRPLTRSAWQDQTRKIGLAKDDGRAFQGPVFLESVEKLKDAGWLNTTIATHSEYAVDERDFPAVFADVEARGRTQALTRPLVPTSISYGWGEFDSILRLALVSREPLLLEAVLKRLSWTDEAVVVRALTPCAPKGWIDLLPAASRSPYLLGALESALARLLPLGDDVLKAAADAPLDELKGHAILAHALRSEPERAAKVGEGFLAGIWMTGARGILALTLGLWDDARALFERATTSKQGKRITKRIPSDLALFEFLLASSPVARPVDLALLPSLLEVSRSSLKPYTGALETFQDLTTYRLSGRISINRPMLSRSWRDVLVMGIGYRWMGRAFLSLEPMVGEVHHAAKAGGYAWLDRQFTAIRSTDEAEPTDLARLSATRESWEAALLALAGVFDSEAAAAAAERSVGEVYWTVGIDEGRLYPSGVELSARLVKRAGQQGAALSVERMRTDTALPLRAEDRPLVEALVAAKKEFHGHWVGVRELLYAVGHTRLRDAVGVALTLEKGESELRVRSVDGGTRIELHPASEPDAAVFAERRGQTVILYERNESIRRLLAVLGEKGVYVPASGLSQVTEAIAKIAPHVPVRGVELLGESAGAKAEPADGRLRVQLFSSGTAFRVRLRVKPAGDEGIALRPGVEPKHVLVAAESGTRSFVRDLPEESRIVEKLLSSSSYLTSLRIDGEDRVAEDLESCLGLLTELGPLSGEDVLVEWPEGRKLRPPLARDEKSLRVRVGGSSQWLSVASDVVVDEGRVLSMAFLLENISRAQGRFVPIGEGEYLELTGKLREQIDALARVATLSDKRGHTSLAALPAIAAWTGGAAVTYEDGMDERLSALAKAQEATHRVPRALEAELRDYQRDGFVFLARRASSGFGACLADDMGLGKTVQALALILSRASAGPSLVVAPTSVCRNWEDEARKFAPTLTFVRLGEAPDRAACIAGLKARDVLLCSYGLLAPAAELLAKRRFSTAVLDEAHALKNADTRRASAARSIQADAMVALSGTPLENHLGELHSLFDLIAPGLLGSRERFERAFAVPISRGDRRAMAHLRALVRPFILRRTKSQVLEELPEKTEMTRTIAPTPAERDFYEAVRRTAIQRIEQAARDKGAQARIEVLAEITKLRRAAIDPRLVGGDSAPAGSKLDALVDLVLELKDEGHRALVFSQFLEVLDRIGASFEKGGIKYVRLDGGMNQKQRADAVETFQSGQVDVFLLSLKAGGVGMNLTAADYVIHVDPWWNPAVEDQATDRAHRIGQTRPVTVVRLVTEGTIEEKVLALHASKRALYEDALSEMDVAKKLDVSALLDLLKDDSVQPLLEGGKKPTRKATKGDGVTG